MSKSGEIASDAAQDGVNQDSVYDFLYHDVRRVASFLSQFDSSGHLTGIKQVEAVGQQEAEEGSVQAAANVVVARATGAFINRRGSSESETSERTYDPLWTNALALLDYMKERDLLTRDLRSARMGQFAIVSGHLMIMDLAMLKAAWEQPDIKKVVRESAKPIVAKANSREQRRAAKPPVVNEIDILFALLKLLPHSLQARVLSDGFSVWCSLDESAVVGRASDLMIKHGTLIGGQWTMVGVVDAFPYDPEYVTENGEPLAAILASLATTPVGQLAVQLAPIAQQLLGRPPTAYGMTPLMIFREVSG
jgi:hypothetical protein